MIKVDLKLPNAYVENVERIKVVKDTELELILNRLEADGDYFGPVDYAATGDPILDITSGEVETTVAIKAKNVGLSRFFFIQKSDAGITPIKEIRIEVVAAIVDPAASLGATGEPIDKDLFN
jgi:Zn/Cd-binding protein ZinT